MKMFAFILLLLFNGISSSSAFEWGPSDKDVELSQVVEQWKFKHEIVEVSLSKNYQSLIDQAYGKIFSTKSAEKICRLLPQKNIEVIRNILGTSHKESKKIDKICSGYIKDSNLAQYKPYPVRLFLVFPEDANFPLIGWSNKFGHSFLFLKSKKNIEEKELVRSLAHELMIRLDLKNYLRYYMVMNRFDDDIIKLKFNVDYTPTDKCRALSVFSNPILRMHFISERAREFEFSVLKELYNDEIEDSYKEISCAEKIRSNQKQLISVASEFNSVDNTDEDITYASASKANNCKAEDSLERLDKDIDFILSEDIIFYRKKQNLCRFFSESWSQILPLFLNSGPGPRIGGGS